MDGLRSAPAPAGGVLSRVLGLHFSRAPELVRHIHGGRSMELVGDARVERGKSIFAKIIATALDLPSARESIPLRVRLYVERDREIWIRTFGQDLPMRSVLRARDGLLIERFDSLELRFRLAVTEGAIGERTVAWTLVGGSLMGIKLPMFLLGKTTASIGVSNDRYHATIDSRMPWGALLVRYEAWLSIGRGRVG